MQKQSGVPIIETVFGGALVLIALLMTVLFSSCGTTYVRPDYSKYVYPPPPDTARIRLVDVYRTGDDLGKSAASIIGGGSTSERLKKPAGVAFDTSGNIVVADQSNGIVIIDKATHKMRMIQHGSISAPVGIAVDKANHIYVADGRSRGIIEFDYDGTFRKKYGQTGWFKNPVGVAVDEAHDRLYASDSHLHRIFVMNLRGDSIGVIGERGDTVGKFNFPGYIALDSAGSLYVVDQLNCRVQIFSKTGAFMRSFGKVGDMLGQFSRPKGIAIDRDQHVYVADALNNNFQAFDQDGFLLTFIGGEGMGPAEFEGMAGMACDGRFIAVVDQQNARVHLFEYLGQPK